MSKVDDFEKGFAWVYKILQHIQPYKPEIRSFSMNYKKNTSTVIFVAEMLDLPKINNYIRLPGNPFMKLEKIRDMYYSEIDYLPQLDTVSQEWKIPIRDLPDSQRYFLEVSGALPINFLKDHIQVDKALQRNRVHADDCDQYWLCASLNKISDIELISDKFEIEEVNIDVKVEIEKHITPCFPDSIKNLLDKKAKWESAAAGREHNLSLLRRQYQAAARHTNISIDDLVAFLEKMVSPDIFQTYVDFPAPFNYSKISRSDNQIPPRTVNVETYTNLSVRNQNPRGYLTFNKKAFKNDIEERLWSEEDKSRKKERMQDEIQA